MNFGKDVTSSKTKYATIMVTELENPYFNESTHRQIIRTDLIDDHPSHADGGQESKRVSITCMEGEICMAGHDHVEVSKEIARVHIHASILWSAR